MEFGTWDIINIIILAVSLCLIGFGYFFKKRLRHLILGFGEILFAVFWLSLVPEYYDKGDIVNMAFCILALPFFSLVAYHEYLCFKRKEELTPLDWIAGTTFITSVIYFSIAYIWFLQQYLVYAVAFKSAAVATLFGYHTEPLQGMWDWTQLQYHVPLDHSGTTSINIVLACTGIQAIALFIGFIISTKPDKSVYIDWANVNLKIVKRKLKKARGIEALRLRFVKRTLENLLWRSNKLRVFLAFMYTVPIIYMTNLLRNAALVYVVYEDKLEFDMAHNVLTKIMALALMLFMLLLLFDVLPELQENVLGLLDVFRFRKKDNVKDGFVELDF
jgi:exosortase/archaeosortase family protein